MSWLRKTILLVSLLMVSAVGIANIQQQLNNLINQYGHNQNVGIAIEHLNSGKKLYEVNGQRLYMPASDLKLFTATAALLYLGPNFHFQTQIVTNTRGASNGTINGDVYIKFSGDPELKSHDLKQLLGQLRAQGIVRIDGKVYIDSSSYDDQFYGHGWMWDELNYCYAAPMSSVIINGNCFPVTLIPANQPGQKAMLEVYNNDQNYLTVHNQVYSYPRSVACSLDLQADRYNIYDFSGCLYSGSPKRTMKLAIKNPPLYAQKLIAQLLHENGIQYSGTINQGKAPANALLLANYFSPPLNVMVTKMLKHSDNLIANSLLKKMGQQYFSRTGTWKNGVKAMQAILAQHVHIDFSHSVVVDGAGLSRYDLVTPEQTIQLLHFIYHDFAVAPEIMAALPIAGVDGTLHYRLTAADTRGRVRAKTGTMQGVTALAGYIKTKQSQNIAFVVMINGFAKPVTNYTRLEDKICELLANYA